jgi:hypothetical protein
MAKAAPDRIIDAEGIIFETPNPAHRSVTAHEAPLLNVLLADGPAAKLADGPRFLFALDAFHGVAGALNARTHSGKTTMALES